MQTQKDLAFVYKLSSSCHPSLIIGKSCYQFFHSLFVQIMTSARTTAVRYIECDFFIQQSCYETTCALGWIIEHYLLIPTCMISLLDQFLALCTHDCGISFWQSWATNFCFIFRNSHGFTRTKLCMYICQPIIYILRFNPSNKKKHMIYNNLHKF